MTHEHKRYREDDFKVDLDRRLKTAGGHLNGIMKMVEDDAYCIDVINQISAVQSSLNKITLMLLDDHMHHCVIDAIQGDDPAERERVLEEIRKVFELRGKL